MISVSVASSGPAVSAHVAGPSLVAAEGGATVSVPAAASTVSTVSGDPTGVEVVALADLLGLAATTPARVVTQVSGVVSLDVASANTFFVDLTADLTSIVWSGRRTDGRSERVTLYLRQAGDGGHVLAPPDGAIKWSRGPPDISAAAGTVDCIVFDLLGEAVYGNLVGLDYQ